MWSRNNRASAERNQRKIDSGFISIHYPEVASIAISMIYSQKGIAKPINRVVNFFPGSHAFFRIDCLSDDCSDGGFDLTPVISMMIRNHKESEKGNMTCECDKPPLDHSNISYDINIVFS